jgi:glycosyltransferase involved in cell wall biosynthesis
LLKLGGADQMSANIIDVSIVLNLHREAKFIQRTLRSILEAIQFAQYRNIKLELIIVMDNSDVNTFDAVSSFDFMLFSNVIVKEVCNGNLGASRNDGVKLASGRYIATADADDLISFNYFSEMYALAIELQENLVFVPQYYVGFGDNYHICEFFDSNRISKLLLFDTHPYVSRVFTAASVFKSIPFAALDRSSPFAYEDWHFNCEAIARGYEFKAVVNTAVYYRQRPGSMLRNADAESLKCIPLSEYHEPRTFLKLQDSQKSSSPQYKLRAPNWMQIRRKFESDAVNLELIYAANKIDPAINYGLPDSFSVFSYLDRSDALGRAYHQVCEIVKDENFTDVFLVPYIVVGGGDKYVIELMNGLVALDASRKLLILCLQPCAEHAWLDRLPATATFIDLAKICENLPPWSHEIIVLRLLQTCAKSASVYLKSSESTLHFYDKYAAVLTSNPTTYFRFMDSVRPSGDYMWALGFDFDFLSNNADKLAYIVSDNDTVLQKDSRSLDRFSKKMHRLYCHCKMPDEVKNSSSDGRKLLWASRLDSQKRPDILLNIAKLLVLELPEVSIDVYGSAVLESFDVSQFSNCPNINYNGPYSNFDALPLETYKGFLYTSDYDGLPNVLLEAMAFGLPVIAPKIGGISEAVNGNTGYLVETSKNQTELVKNYIDAIRHMMSNEDVRSNRSAASRRHIKANHSWPAYVSRLDEIYSVSKKINLVPRKNEHV